MNEHPALWLGTCSTCGAEYEMSEDVLRANLPVPETDFASGVHLAGCICTGQVIMRRSMVKVVSYGWVELSAGCSVCGADHEPELPHNRESLLYQESFRRAEGEAGRQERWPTWNDAMAHCTEEVRQGWTKALAMFGIPAE